jgi:hypothetical protein
VIAHVAGLPLEETIPQIAGAAVAVGILVDRARARLRSIGPRRRNGRRTPAVNATDRRS